MRKVPDKEGIVVKEISILKNKPSTLNWDNRKYVLRASQDIC